jgi:hypothetical protein
MLLRNIKTIVQRMNLPSRLAVAFGTTRRNRFRRCEYVLDEPNGLYEFIVEPRELTTQHRLTRKVFDEWLRRPGGTPADVTLKTRLRALLGVSPQAFSEVTDGKRPTRRKREP